MDTETSEKKEEVVKKTEDDEMKEVRILRKWLVCDRSVVWKIFRKKYLQIHFKVVFISSSASLVFYGASGIWFELFLIARKKKSKFQN